MAESDSSKVRNKLRKFLQRRPTLQSLRERGYIKGRGPPQAQPLLSVPLLSPPCSPLRVLSRPGLRLLPASAV